MYDFIHKSTWTCITKGKDIVVNSLSTGNIKHFPTTRGKVLPPFFISYIIYLKFYRFWNFKFLKIFFYEVIISFKSLNARKIKPRK